MSNATRRGTLGGLKVSSMRIGRCLLRDSALRLSLAVSLPFASSVALAAEWLIPSPECGNNNAAVIALTNALAQAQAGDTVTLAKGTYDLAGFVSDSHATYLDSHLYMPGRKILLRGTPSCTRDEVVLKGGGIRILRIAEKSNGYDKAPAFENLTFTNGVTAYWAGAVFLNGNDGDCGYYTNCAFRCCSANDRCGTAWGGTFSQCYFEGNSAGKNYAGCSSRAVAYDCTFVNNSVTGNGGTLNLSKAYRCVFSNNTATSSGGALSNCKGAFDCVFVGNSAGNEGAIQCDGNTKGIVVSNCVFEANHGGSASAGCVSLSTEGQVVDCKFFNNWIAGSGAGAVRASASDNGACVYNSIFTNNASWSGYGVGKDVSLWSNCTFIANSLRVTSDEGPCAGIFGGKAIKCTFRDQYSTQKEYRADPRLPCVRDNVHSTGSHACAQACELCNCDINGTIVDSVADRCEIWGVTNTYGLIGGNSVLTNCLIRDNILTGQRTVVSWGSSGRDPQFVNCTVVNNEGRMFFTSNAVAINTLFCDNRDYNGTSQDIGCNNKNGVVLSNCCYRTGSSNAIYVNCIKLGANESPKFNENLNPDYPYYMPRNKSPVVGKGLVFGWPDGAVDLGGYPRLNGERIDIGCYEAWISTGLILMVW